MNDLISRQEAIDALIRWYGCEPSDIDDFRRIIEELPSAQQKHGRWIEHHEPFTWMGYTTWTCSKCEYECGYEKEIGFRTPCCPNCGARMGGVKE